MKNLKINIAVLLLGMAALTGVSCKKSFYSNVNVNINAPDSSSIIPSVLLSTVEASLAYTQGGDLSRYTSLITQQTLGEARQVEGYYQYTLTSVDFDALFGNLYTSVMLNNRKLMNLADAKSNNRYSGISRILMAYTLQLAVDAWGPLPYSDAFNGANKLQSKYDNDKALYDTINRLLTVAIAQLRSPSPGFAVPGSEDEVYGGDAARWILFAHAIKARLYIHQSKGDAAMANNALMEITQAFTSNNDNAVYHFQDAETAANPWYQFNEQRGDIAFVKSPLAIKMAAANDPRYLVFTDPTFNDVNGVGMGEYYGSISAPVEFITYDELQFMKAEATLIATPTNIAAAQASYRLAIQRNMEKLAVAPAEITNYLAAKGSLPASAGAAIAQVAAEEFTALYLNPEAWTLWRRTNSPSLTPVVGTSIPRRFLYPQTEYSYNAANIPGTTTLFTPRIFWDK